MKFKYKNKIEAKLKFFFNDKKVVDNLSPEIYDAIKKLEEFTLRGGKRIRAILITMGYLACNGKNLKEIIKISSSIELLQSFLLIHDDIFDQDYLRRGGPTIHTSFNKKYNKKVSENLAIELGDIGFCYAIEPLLNSSFNDKKKIIALKEFIKIAKETCYGQFLDILSETKKVDQNFIRRIHEYKTARYTISGPLKLGAIFAGADKKVIKGFDVFGLNLGRAFQINDDILGMFGDEKKLGKPIASDLIEGKKTLLILKAKSNYVNKKIGGKLSAKEIKKIKKIIIESGSLEYSEKLIRRLINEAKKNLEKLKIKKEQKEILLHIADYIGLREK